MTDTFKALKYWPDFLCGTILAALLLFDCITRQFGGLLFEGVGLNDYFIAGSLVCLVPFIFGRLQYTALLFVPSVALLMLLIIKLAAARGHFLMDPVLREGQFALRFFALPVIVALMALRRASLEVFLRVWVWMAIVVIAIGVIQVGAALLSVDIVPWARGRSGGLLRQMTSVFYEPAVCAQFLVSTLFVIAPDSESCLKRVKFCGLVALAVLGTQSLGGLAGLGCWVGYVLFRRGLSGRGKSRVVLLSCALAIVAIGFSVMAKDNRVATFFRSGDLEMYGSAGRRVLVEQQAASEFLSTSSALELAIGLSTDEARYFRQQQRLTHYHDYVAGNGVVELLIRYGVVGLGCTLLGMTIGSRRGLAGVTVLLFLLISQIDGAVAKPWVFAYIGFFVGTMRARSKRISTPKTVREVPRGSQRSDEALAI